MPSTSSQAQAPSAMYLLYIGGCHGEFHTMCIAMHTSSTRPAHDEEQRERLAGFLDDAGGGAAEPVGETGPLEEEE